nr:hypothetical protein [Oceanococcus sp. HetDA_MAG_MS8]
MAAYPEWVLRALAEPSQVLPSPRPTAARRVASADTPASEEKAVLYCEPTAQRWYWRAVASPWLLAMLEGVCSRLQTQGVDAAAAWLEELEIPPTKRYCVVLTRSLLSAVRELENDDG